MSHRVLIIEDEPDIRFVIREILEAEKFIVTEADHGLHGLQILQQSDHFDLILLDWNMPVLDGEEFLREWIRKPKKKIPIVVISALERPPSEHYRAILKPFKIAELLALIRQEISLNNSRL